MGVAGLQGIGAIPVNCSCLHSYCSFRSHIGYELDAACEVYCNAALPIYNGVSPVSHLKDNPGFAA